MNGRWFQWLFGAIAAMFFCSAPLHAADFTFYVGGVMPGSVVPGGSTYQNLKTSLDKSPIYGLRLATNFVPHFGMEHTLGFSSDYLFPKSVAAIRDAKGFVYNTNLIINMPVSMKSFIPYVTAGVGLIHQYGDANVPIGTKFAINYGGGVKIPRLAGPLGLRFDMRGYRATGIFSSSLNMLEFSGGILLSMSK
jgi:hypothetical protein